MFSTIYLPPSFRRQQLILLFSSLQPLLPPGVYLSLSPTNPSLWSVVLFVRSPSPSHHDTDLEPSLYESAVLRFTLSLPYTYPEHPPSVVFSSDIFHPLIVPLTTYTLSGAGDDGVSAGDVEGRLGPGAFSLRHGFPQWSQNTRASSGIARDSLENNTPTKHGLELGLSTATPTTTTLSDTFPPPPTSEDDSHSVTPDHEAVAPSALDLTLQLLNYITHTFTFPTALDTLPLSHAGNPSAWHAYRSHRGLPQTDSHPQAPERGRSPASSPTPAQPQESPRHPSSWNWDGVFESRVAEGVRNSIAESTLYGQPVSGFVGGNMLGTPGRGTPGAAGGVSGRETSLIRFEKVDREKLAEIRNEVRELYAPE